VHKVKVGDDDCKPGAVVAVFGNAGLDRGAGWKGREWNLMAACLICTARKTGFASIGTFSRTMVGFPAWLVRQKSSSAAVSKQKPSLS
jgi:hypothetical protein